MEQEPESFVPGRAEEQSGSLLLTYFQGDINSMVDAHFSRALAKATKPKGENTKNKRVRKSVKSEVPNMSHWNVPSPYETNHLGRIELGRSQDAPSNNNQPLNAPGEGSRIWIGGPGQGTNLLLPPMYPPTTTLSDLVATNNRSLLSLLQTNQSDMSSVMVDSTKQEFMPGWARHPGFGDQMPPDQSLDSGLPMIEKKDLYWY